MKNNFVTFSKMPVYSRVPTLSKRGKSNISWAKNKSGVYQIFEKSRYANDYELVYIGYSRSSLYKTILRHFQTWNDTEQVKRISYANNLIFNGYEYKVQITFIPKDNEKAYHTEMLLIDKFKPRDNKENDYYNYDGGSTIFHTCKKCYNESIKNGYSVKNGDDWGEKFSYHPTSGELLDKDGNVIF